MSGVEDCFYHEAIATGNTSQEKQSAPAISQIPGWGCEDPSSSTQSFGGRRMGLFEHDSNYVRLAKQGGRPNLLSHPESADITKKERVAYSKPDWMVYESFQASPERVRADVVPDYMIHDSKPVPSHLPGGGGPPWAQDGQSCFRREGEDTVRSYKTTRIDNVAKPGQKRIDFNNNNNNNGDFKNFLSFSNHKADPNTNRRFQNGVPLGELESDFRDARHGRDQAAAAAVAATTPSNEYSPSSPSAPRRYPAE